MTPPIVQPSRHGRDRGRVGRTGARSRPESHRLTRGAAGGATVELVLVVPVLVFMIMIVIHVGLYWHATHVAQAAAAEGVRAARVVDGTASAGRTRAEQFVAIAAPTLLRDVTVTATRDGQHATLHVRATVQAVVPGLEFMVAVTTQSPVEQFRPDTP